MLKAANYVRPKTVEEALQLAGNKRNIVLGGMTWLKMQDRNAGTLIDLCDLGLDSIEETETSFRIGAMVCLHALECSEALNDYTHGLFEKALKPIVGVQFRNTATVGGSLFGRYGFSDVLTVFLALQARIILASEKTVSLDEFCTMDYDRDILLYVEFDKNLKGCAYASIRNQSTDFPVLTSCTAVHDNGWNFVVGARPMKARSVFMEHPDFADLSAFCKELAAQFSYGSNIRASAEYRQAMAAVLLKRCIEQTEREEK